ncbi:cysteinyl-tRNA synthetase [Paraburkholderia sp. GAS448]
MSRILEPGVRVACLTALRTWQQRTRRLGRAAFSVAAGFVLAHGTAVQAGAENAAELRQSAGLQVGTPDGASGSATDKAMSEARALPPRPTWVAYYGAAADIDVERLGRTFKVIIIDADPDPDTDYGPAFDATQIALLKAHGAKVLSYLNFGACEQSRSYWSRVPAGFVSCRANKAAWLGRYQGYPEYWMNVGNAQFQHLIADYVAPRLVAAGVDGLMLDNVEVIDHDRDAREGMCDAACRQGGLDLVATLRSRYPKLSIVLNNAPVSALGATGGRVAFPLLVDGVFAEDVFLPSTSRSLVSQLRAWSDAARIAGRRHFFVGTLDYATSCSANAAARRAWNASTRAGFSPSVETIDLDSICWWPWFKGSG